LPDFSWHECIAASILMVGITSLLNPLTLHLVIKYISMKRSPVQSSQKPPRRIRKLNGVGKSLAGWRDHIRSCTTISLNLRNAEAYAVL
jgi:hypothetical protein